jgi:hypothetical protein
MDLAMKMLLGPVLLNKKKEKKRLPAELYDEHIFVENDHYSYCSQRTVKAFRPALQSIIVYKLVMFTRLRAAFNNNGPTSPIQ